MTAHMVFTKMWETGILGFILGLIFVKHVDENPNGLLGIGFGPLLTLLFFYGGLLALIVGIIGAIWT
jgi:hypothetical protein